MVTYLDLALIKSLGPTGVEKLLQILVKELKDERQLFIGV